MFNSALLGSLGIVVNQDHYGGHCTRENGCPCNDAVEIQTPKIRMMLFDLRWVQV
jgi:hypothetical protein